MTTDRTTATRTPGDLDTGDLVWIASTVLGIDPGHLLDLVRIGELDAVSAEVAGIDDAVVAAAAALTAIVGRRPFPRRNAAIGWLTAATIAATSGELVPPDDHAVVELCGTIRRDAIARASVATTLAEWFRAAGLECPACGRRVYVGQERILGASSSGTGFAIVARCAYEHAAHDRRGRLHGTGAAASGVHEVRHPILAAGECGSILVVDSEAALVVSPVCEEPPTYRVVEVDEVRAADLVGRWDGLVARSRTIGYIGAADLSVDAARRVDVATLRAAIRRSPFVPALVGAR